MIIKMSFKYEQLIDLNFSVIGFWKTSNEGLSYEVLDNKHNEFETIIINTFSNHTQQNFFPTYHKLFQ